MAEISALLGKAYTLSRRSNVSALVRQIESQRAKKLMSYIVDEGARQQRLKKMNTRRTMANHHSTAPIKIYVPSPLGPRKTRRHRKQ